MAHAVGGSLGSAIALLLLYPLERARVELQTLTASASSSSSSSSASSSSSINHQNNKHPLNINDKVQPIQQSSSRGEEGANGDHKDTKDPSSLSSDESWVTCLRSPENLSPSSDEDGDHHHPSHAVRTAHSDNTQTNNQDLGLISCIYQLHQQGQLYSGVTPVVITMAVSNYVFFYMHSFLKQLLLSPANRHWLQSMSSSNSKGAAAASGKLYLSLIASSLAGIINVLLTNPLWVANLRIVTSSSSSRKQHDNDNNKNENLWRELQQIVQTEGWGHLWQGTAASLLLVSNPVIQFVAYEQIKTRWLQYIHRHRLHPSTATTAMALKPMEAFLLGALAKAISTILTYPLQLAQTVLRVQKQEATEQTTSSTLSRWQEQGQQQPSSSPSSSTPQSSSLQSTPSLAISMQQQQAATQTCKGTLDCLIQIYRRKGLEGWFAGMRTKLLQTVLTAAFTFLTYEQILRAIMTVHRALLARRRKQLAG